MQDPSKPIWFNKPEEININLSNKDINLGPSNISIMVCTPVHSEVSMHYTQALLEFQKAVEDYPCFVAHNAEFDFLIIKNNAEKLNIKLNLHEYFCTMKSSTNYCMIKSDHPYSPYKWPRLSELAQKMQIDYTPDKLHNSEEDVSILIKCFFKGVDIGIF